MTCLRQYANVVLGNSVSSEAMNFNVFFGNTDANLLNRRKDEHMSNAKESFADVSVQM